MTAPPTPVRSSSVASCLDRASSRPPSRQRSKRSKSFYLLLLLLPLGWFWWKARESKTVEEPSLADQSIGMALTTADEPKRGKEPWLPPPRFAIEEMPSLPPPAVNQGTITSAVDPNPSPGDVSNAAIAAFGPDTVKMLNSHKYWTPNGLVDGLYDAWADKRNQGLDVEDARQQINWALKGMFMENY